MPATSKAQQKLMGMALAYKRGELKDASDKVKKIAKGMTEKELEDFASTSTEDLPEKVTEVRAKLREVIKSVLDEMSVTGAIDGYQTPFAFSGEGDEEKKKRKLGIDAMGYEIMENNNIKSEYKKIEQIVFSNFNGKVKNNKLKNLGLENNDIELLNKLYRNAVIEASKKYGIEYEDNYKDNFGNVGVYVHNMNDNDQNKIKQIFLKKILSLKENNIKPSITESVDWSNKDIPHKKKIFDAMRVIKNNLNEIERTLDRTLKYKTENELTSDSYWKRAKVKLETINKQLIRVSNKIKGTSI